MPSRLLSCRGACGGACASPALSTLAAADGQHGFFTDLYMSGTTFFTLGLGDVVPRSDLARFLTVVEAGIGFAFLAVVIGYLPILYQAFSRREVEVSLLDARAGSPSSAVELLRRHAGVEGADDLCQLLRGWEHWSAELLESHLSYPSLGYFRSQHEHQSWVAALTTILDACARACASCWQPRGWCPRRLRPRIRSCGICAACTSHTRWRWRSSC